MRARPEPLFPLTVFFVNLFHLKFAMNDTEASKIKCLICGYTFSVEEIDRAKRKLKRNQNACSCWCSRCGVENLVFVRSNRFVLKD